MRTHSDRGSPRRLRRSVRARQWRGGGGCTSVGLPSSVYHLESVGPDSTHTSSAVPRPTDPDTVTGTYTATGTGAVNPRAAFAPSSSFQVPDFAAHVHAGPCTRACPYCPQAAHQAAPRGAPACVPYVLYYASVMLAGAHDALPPLLYCPVPAAGASARCTVIKQQREHHITRQ